MSVLDAEQRARRRRLEGGLLVGLLLALTATGALLCAAQLTAAFADAGALLAGIG